MYKRGSFVSMASLSEGQQSIGRVHLKLNYDHSRSDFVVEILGGAIATFASQKK